MKKTLRINASIDQPELLENMVEKLAYRRYNIGYGKEKMPKGWEANETSTTEAYINGTIELNYKRTGKFRIPFITSFLFTCAHGQKEPYKLNWSMSLS
jgi:hypothetical protein